ncbi:MAG: serine hydrolase, partial [Synergistaceae bacterium]|nr:serine hydrolase [Synergistaceae bacterium]
MRTIRRLIMLVLTLSLTTTPLYAASESGNVMKVSSLPSYQWQKTASFPNWLGRVDDTLAVNSIIGFHFWHSQGEIYLRLSEGVKSFGMFINGKRVNTSAMNTAGVYALDISGYTIDGINSLQISNINIANKNAISVFIPYPVILRGSIENSGIRPETLAMISDIIASDTANGFPSAQLAVIRNGRLVYSNSWGNNIDTNTLYDLASVSKVFGVNYAIQKLVSEKKLDIDT